MSTFVVQLHLKSVHRTCTLTLHSDRAEWSVQLFCRERVKTGPKIKPGVHALVCARASIMYAYVRLIVQEHRDDDTAAGLRRPLS